MRRITIIFLVFLWSSCSDNKQKKEISEVDKPQIVFDYSGARMLINHFSESKTNIDSAILNHAGYKLIFEHSAKYSSNPITKKDLLQALDGKKNVFDFREIPIRIDTLSTIIQFLKDNEKEILNEYAGLPLKYLPKSYNQNAKLFYVIGGYNGIAMNDKICVNIDYAQFRKNNSEIKLYIAHELFHIGFEKYHPLPDIFGAKTVKDLKNIVLSMTMNEGLATLTTYHKRIETNELNDYDYKVLLDSVELNKKLIQFDNVMKFMDDNLEKEVTNEILGNVLGQCSGDRLFYIVGCHMGLTIEEKYGISKIVELVEDKPEKFFETYKKIKVVNTVYSK